MDEPTDIERKMLEIEVETEEAMRPIVARYGLGFVVNLWLATTPDRREGVVVLATNLEPVDAMKLLKNSEAAVSATILTQSESLEN